MQIEGANEYVNVQKLAPTSLTKAHLEIKVSKVEHKAGGLFSFAYWEYTVETIPFEWTVIRRESDFIKLREVLVKKFPHYAIPPLIIPKDANSGNEQAIAKTKEDFQMFLNSLILNEEILCSSFLEEFLSIHDYKGFKEVKKLREAEK